MTTYNIFIIIFIVTVVVYLALRRYYKISSLAFFYGLLGLLVGIFVAAILALPFNYIKEPYSYWMPWVISYLTPLLFLEIFLFQGERLFRFLQRIVGSGLQSIWIFKRYIPPIMIDQQTLANPKFLKMVQAGFVWGHVMVPNQVFERIKKGIGSPNRAQRVSSMKAFEVYSILAETPRIILEKVELHENINFYDSLLETTYNRGGKILTFDQNLAERAKKAGVEAIDLNKIIK